MLKEEEFQEQNRGVLEEGNGRPETSKCSRQQNKLNKTLTNFRNTASRGGGGGSTNQGVDGVISDRQQSRNGTRQGRQHAQQQELENNNCFNMSGQGFFGVGYATNLEEGVTLDKYFGSSFQVLNLNPEEEKSDQKKGSQKQTTQIHETDEEYSESNRESGADIRLGIKIDSEESSKCFIPGSQQSEQSLGTGYSEMESPQSNKKKYIKGISTNKRKNQDFSLTGEHQIIQKKLRQIYLKNDKFDSLHSKQPEKVEANTSKGDIQGFGGRNEKDKNSEKDKLADKNDKQQSERVNQRIRLTRQLAAARNQGINHSAVDCTSYLKTQETASNQKQQQQLQPQQNIKLIENSNQQQQSQQQQQSSRNHIEVTLIKRKSAHESSTSKQYQQQQSQSSSQQQQQQQLQPQQQQQQSSYQSQQQAQQQLSQQQIQSQQIQQQIQSQLMQQQWQPESAAKPNTPFSGSRRKQFISVKPHDQDQYSSILQWQQQQQDGYISRQKDRDNEEGFDEMRETKGGSFNNDILSQNSQQFDKQTNKYNVRRINHISNNNNSIIRDNSSNHKNVGIIINNANISLINSSNKESANNNNICSINNNNSASGYKVTSSPPQHRDQFQSFISQSRKLSREGAVQLHSHNLQTVAAESTLKREQQEEQALSKGEQSSLSSCQQTQSVQRRSKYGEFMDLTFDGRQPEIQKIYRTSFYNCHSKAQQSIHQADQDSDDLNQPQIRAPLSSSQQPNGSSSSKNGLKLKEFSKQSSKFEEAPQIMHPQSDEIADSIMRRTAKENKLLNQKEKLTQLIRKQDASFLAKYAAKFNLNNQECESLMGSSINGGNANMRAERQLSKKRADTPQKQIRGESQLGTEYAIGRRDVKSLATTTTNRQINTDSAQTNR